MSVFEGNSAYCVRHTIYPNKFFRTDKESLREYFELTSLVTRLLKKVQIDTDERVIRPDQSIKAMVEH